MKQKFKFKTKDEVVISVEVQIKASRYTLTRDEQIDLKNKLKNDVHALLRNNGYDVDQIKVVR